MPQARLNLTPIFFPVVRATKAGALTPAGAEGDGEGLLI